MKSLIDFENWKRKEHFQFFDQFDEPFFGINSEIDVSIAYHFCKENNISFFLFYLFQATKAVNLTDEFRYRIEDGKVFDYHTIHVTATIGRADNTFAFSFMPYSGNFDEFVAAAKKEIEEVGNSSGLRFNEDAKRNDVIHFSSIPWISFKAISHARSFGYKDSVPKITFGKFHETNGKLLMPVSIHAHHGLMDAYHLAKYLGLFAKLLDNPSV